MTSLRTKNMDIHSEMSQLFIDVSQVNLFWTTRYISHLTQFLNTRQVHTCSNVIHQMKGYIKKFNLKNSNEKFIVCIKI